MGIDRFCPHCGCVFYGQRTGKCPSCENGAIIKEDGLYYISPEALKRFRDFDKNGGDLSSLKPPNKNIAVIQVATNRNWVSLSILGSVVTFNKELKVIYSTRNADGEQSESQPQ